MLEGTRNKTASSHNAKKALFKFEGREKASKNGYAHSP